MKLFFMSYSTESHLWRFKSDFCYLSLEIHVFLTGIKSINPFKQISVVHKWIIRLHQVQTIVSDVRSVCQSVGARWTFCQTGVLIPAQREGVGHNFEFCDPPYISATAAARDLKFCVHIEVCGS